MMVFFFFFCILNYCYYANVRAERLADYRLAYIFVIISNNLQSNQFWCCASIDYSISLYYDYNYYILRL